MHAAARRRPPEGRPAPHLLPNRSLTCRSVSLASPFSCAESCFGVTPEAQTFRAFLAYVDTQRPLTIIFENVDTMADAGEADKSPSNMDIMLSEMSGRGYEAQQFITESSEFGLPTRRRRFYVVFVLAIANPGVDFSRRGLFNMFTTLKALVAACRRKPPCATELLLPLHSTPVTEALLRRQDVATKRTGQLCGGGWTELHAKEFHARGMRWGSSKIDAETACSPWYDTLTPREKDPIEPSLLRLT